MDDHNKSLPKALALLSSERPRNVDWLRAAALLFGDWGTSRLYVLGLAFLVAGRSSFWLIGGMSLLILAVGWAYTQICRIYPDGGGVYTAAKHRSKLLGVIGALLLFADYTVTASLSAVDAFHYLLPQTHAAATTPEHDHPVTPAMAADGVKHDVVGDDIHFPDEHKDDAKKEEPKEQEKLLDWRSPGLWALVSIIAIGAFNLLGPKHSSAFALFAAVGMVVITLLVVVFALPNVDWRHLSLGRFWQNPLDMWRAFVYVVLALSGVEAIANLTGVMKKPVFATSQKSIWFVAAEVAIFNLLLTLAMIALAGFTTRDAHTGDMLAFIARGPHGERPWLEWLVRIISTLR